MAIGKDGKVPMSDMTAEKQLARAQELFPNTTQATLQDVRMNANSDDKRYIMYGIRSDEK